MSQYFTRPPQPLDPSFARALLFAGLLPPRIARRQTLPEAAELRELLVAQWHRLQGRAWAWRLREGSARLIRSDEDSHHLVEAADQLMTEARDDWGTQGRGLRLEVNIPDGFDPFYLYRILLQTGAHSAFLRHKSEGEMSWSWPLRIGVAEGSRLLARLTPDSPLWPLFQAFNYERAPMRANLLLCEASFSEVIKTMSSIQRRPQTDGLVVFGGIGDTGISIAQLLTLLESTGAQGVFIFDPLLPDLARSVTHGLIANLSHDLPLDSAIARLAVEYQVPVLSWATRSLVETTSVRKQGQMMARRLKEMGDASIRLPSDVFGPPAGPTGRLVDKVREKVFRSRPRTATAKRVTARELGNALEENPHAKSVTPLLSFEHESDGGKKLADIAMATAAESDADAARHEARYLQVRVETPGGRAIQGAARLLSSREYVARVFIGSLDPTWQSLDQPLQTPEPPDASPLLLDVLFWESESSPEPQVAQLTLPRHGNTGVAEFPFRTTEKQSTFSARIAVYHRNRNLQTGLLKGRVGNEPADLRFTLDATPQAKFIGLSDRASAGASIIVNNDPSGAKQAFVFSDGKASVAPVDVDPGQHKSLADLTSVLGRAITRITKEPEAYSDLSRDESRTLLLELAQHGSRLLTTLKQHTFMRDRFDKVDYIQIVTAHADAFLPIEYIYEGRAPEDQAKICSDSQAASEALTSGKCCGAYEGDPRFTICPLRFWSLSKVIERHAHLPEHTSLHGKFQLRSDPVSARNRWLDPLRGAVVAASKDANAADANTVKNLCDDLDTVLRTHPVPFATNWESWAKSIAQTRPNLLVLLPHHEQAGGFDLLEIGGDARKSVLIGEEHVRSPEDPDARPIVLLIGCETNAAKVDLEGFVPVFQDAGAVIIVSTIATILGRHAGPAAAAIVRELKKQEGNESATFGDVMLAVRRRLLATGTLMVLGLTSYGDADWRIGVPPGTVK